MGIPTFTPYKLPGDAQTPVTAFDFQKAQDQIANTLNALVKALGDFRPGTDLGAYQLLSGKDAASGYAGLDASSLIDSAEVPWATPGAIGGTTPAAGTFTALECTLGDFLGSNPLLHVRDEKASGTAGGGFTSGAWQTRTLTVAAINQISGASLASNQITLPAGTYQAWARGPGFRVDQHKLKLYNVTGTADLLIGSNAFSNSGASYAQTDSVLAGQFTLSADSVLELRHRCTTTEAINGFGVLAGFGVVEVYAEVMIWQLA